LSMPSTISIAVSVIRLSQVAGSVSSSMFNPRGRASRF
jgi:hypothetical protein